MSTFAVAYNPSEYGYRRSLAAGTLPHILVHSLAGRMRPCCVSGSKPGGCRTLQSSDLSRAQAGPCCSVNVPLGVDGSISDSSTVCRNCYFAPLSTRVAQFSGLSGL